VDFLNNSNQKRSGNKLIFNRMFLFPVGVLIIYVILFLAAPDKAGQAIKSTGNVILSMLIPLCLVFFIMLLINLFLKPAAVANFLGKGSGVKAIVLSAIAGIISTGPIYAWYPLLKDLRDKGAGESSIAIFLYNRAVKPFLLPVMIGYFGWLYVVILTILMILASVAVGFSVSSFSSPKMK
jgi:uncharacterized membrane protein YraQ (UPF0718 family)